jgi:hypothetical protein
VHFATAREAFNMATAAIDGKNGSPNEFRDYRLHSIMQNGAIWTNRSMEMTATLDKIKNIRSLDEIVTRGGQAFLRIANSVAAATACRRTRNLRRS